MDFFLTFQNVSVLFMLIIVGYVIGKLNIITVSGQTELTNLVLKVTLPVTIILAFQLEYTKERFITALNIMLIVGLSFLGMILLAKVISKMYRISDNRQDIVEVALILPNATFMGFPIVLAVLGKEALFYAVLGAGFVFQVVSWTYGVYVIQRSSGKGLNKDFVKNILLSPNIVAIIIGSILFISSTVIPEPVNTTMVLLSQATSPLAMLVIGILLSRTNIKESFLSGRLYTIALIRLLVFPLIIFSILKLLGFSGMEITIPVVILSMPTAAYVAMFSASANNDANFASQIVFISSLLSVLTIPFMVMLVS